MLDNNQGKRLNLNHDLSGGIKTTISEFEETENPNMLANHESTKAYIDREVSIAKQGLIVQEPCRVATTNNTPSSDDDIDNMPSL